jgi:hypothetical protein
MVHVGCAEEFGCMDFSAMVETVALVGPFPEKHEPLVNLMPFRGWEREAR